MSFLGWVVTLAGLPVVSAAEAVRQLWNAIRRLWQIIVDTLHAAIRALASLGAASWHLADLAFRALDDLGRILRWVMTVYIPSVAHTAYTSSLRVVNAVVHDLRILITLSVAALRRTLVAIINTVRATLASLTRWAAEQVTRLWRLLNWSVAIVRELLTNPERLATWILPALTRPLLRFLESRGVAIGRWLLRRSISAGLGLSHIIEDVITRVI